MHSESQFKCNQRITYWPIEIIRKMQSRAFANISFDPNKSFQVWSLNTHKLKGLKSADALDNLNRDADDVLHRMMDESSSAIIKNLYGHSGPVSKESFLSSF